METKNKQYKIWFVLLIVGVLFLAACGGNTNTVDNNGQNVVVDEPPEEFVPPIALGFELGEEQMRASDAKTVQLDQGYPQVIEFFAYWCDRCQQMAPVIHGLEGKYSDYLPFSYVDIDVTTGEGLQEEVGYDRRWRPYIMLVNSAGEVEEVFVGVIPGEQIEIALQQLLVNEGLVQ